MVRDKPHYNQRPFLLSRSFFAGSQKYKSADLTLFSIDLEQSGQEITELPKSTCTIQCLCFCKCRYQDWVLLGQILAAFSQMTIYLNQPKIRRSLWCNGIPLVFSILSWDSTPINSIEEESLIYTKMKCLIFSNGHSDKDSFCCLTCKV